MNEATFRQRLGLRVPIERLDEVRAILSTEGGKERAQQGRGDTELMRVCCAALFNAGVESDSLLVWRAKTASMDSDASIDIQLLCGAGLERTLEWLNGPKRWRGQRSDGENLRFVYGWRVRAFRPGGLQRAPRSLLRGGRRIIVSRSAQRVAGKAARMATEVPEDVVKFVEKRRSAGRTLDGLRRLRTILVSPWPSSLPMMRGPPR